MITSLPQATSASLSDIIYAVQGYTSSSSLGTSVQETLQQVLSLITAGSNISVSFSGGNLVIAATGLAGIGWNSVTGTSATVSANAGYVTNNAGQVTLLLPTTAAFGSIIYVVALGAGGFKISQNASQSIRLSGSITTTGTGGSLTGVQGDSLTLVCTVANTNFNVLGGPQSAGLTIV